MDKSLRRMRRARLIEMILALQKNEEALVAERDELKRRLDLANMEIVRILSEANAFARCMAMENQAQLPSPVEPQSEVISFTYGMKDFGPQEEPELDEPAPSLLTPTVSLSEPVEEQPPASDILDIDSILGTGTVRMDV